MTRVVLVSDPYHSARIDDIADEVGLDAVTSPTRTSPITGASGVAALRHRDDAGRGRPHLRIRPARPAREVRGSYLGRRALARDSVSLIALLRGWCNRQHNRFWSCILGVRVLPPERKRTRKPRSSSGLGRHPLMVVDTGSNPVRGAHLSRRQRFRARGTQSPVEERGDRCSSSPVGAVCVQRATRYGARVAIRFESQQPRSANGVGPGRRRECAPNRAPSRLWSPSHDSHPRVPTRARRHRRGGARRPATRPSVSRDSSQILATCRTSRRGAGCTSRAVELDRIGARHAPTRRGRAGRDQSRSDRTSP